ncbi:hypothetical protein AGABI1DRAFT_108021 [Agaricus bisporus var. burnettii JB137-S8]|uniref:NodB homology domain-containing protein n=1 Tax=Agaricus bisporus var. burnettii (strain JB137-S8 / ATCC MYA-4627 / FGSC 10392) TaxID=597362 RepID=K5WQ58_AGABU|nr:uncharacterized protein AGABI1DRAFT_108021 [Agaricus bisporus var. burnettii JB137-S8]EKM77491.1 hypothetical protein AGABI1DRAFT_108021 [Agaricus bisporus var. burnettii JB137-S8]
MLPNAISLPSLASVNSLGSLASLSSLGCIGMGLACVATTVSGSVIPNAEAREPENIAVGMAGAGNELNYEVATGFESIRDGSAIKLFRPRAPQEGEGDGSSPVSAAPGGGGGGGGGGKAQVITTCSVPGTAALTFEYIFSEEVSKILKDNNAKGTFFFIGCITSPADAARVKAVYDAGHQVASHSWNHKDLATLSKDEILSEMSSVSQAIQQITGVRPAQMRPPFGSYNDAVLEAAGQIGEDVVIWNLDSGDSVGAAPDESKARYNQAAQGNSPILALNHETHESTVKDVLPAAIQILQNSGYRLVTVAECTGREPYLMSDAPPLTPACTRPACAELIRTEIQ